MTVATPPHCRTVRSWISAAYDDELTVDRQIVMNSHLASCDRCRRARDEMAVLGIALRRGAAEQRPDDTAFAGLATEVLAGHPSSSTRAGVDVSARWSKKGLVSGSSAGHCPPHWR